MLRLSSCYVNPAHIEAISVEDKSVYVSMTSGKTHLAATYNSHAAAKLAGLWLSDQYMERKEMPSEFEMGFEKLSDPFDKIV